MMPIQLTPDEKDRIAKKIKSYLSDNPNCRVGWAVEIVTGQKIPTTPANLNAISATVILDRRYKRDRSVVPSDDWDITLNPDFSEPKSNPFISYKDIAIWVFGVFGGVVSMLIYDGITSKNGGKNEQVTEPTKTEIEQWRQQSDSVPPADSTHTKNDQADSLDNNLKVK